VIAISEVDPLLSQHLDQVQQQYHGPTIEQLPVTPSTSIAEPGVKTRQDKMEHHRHPTTPPTAAASVRTTPSPQQRPLVQIDESQLPRGQCRYIMTMPEIKGQRCACVSFTINRGMRGATCECGHLACFHIHDLEQPHSQKEFERLKQRLQQLEEHIARGQEDGRDTLTTRISEVEERLDKSREEFTEQIKGAYRNITRSWTSITELERRDAYDEERMRRTDSHLKDVDAELRRLNDRQLELVDADICLEERIENLAEAIEEGDDQSMPRQRRPRRRSTSDTQRPANALGISTRSRLNSRSLAQRPRSFVEATTGSPISPIEPIPASQASSQSGVTSAPLPGIWTVHISLLPNASKPFPFERNTNAYQRCLSRGLHRTIAIPGVDSDSFKTAVSQTFEHLLRSRPWMPLEARLCDAKQLRGLPMLRPLDAALLDQPYDSEFLRKNCAVCDPSGNIDSLYIAMRSDSLSWHALKQAPIWLDGLEQCWAYDPLLDAVDTFVDDKDEQVHQPNRPAAGDIVSNLPSLKRAASEISRSASFGAANAPPVGDPESRAKRSCPPQAAIIDVPRNAVKTI
jgi:hypothetical protein